MKNFILTVIVLFVASCSFKTAKQETTAGGSSYAASIKKKSGDSKREKQKKELEQAVHDAQPIIENILQALNEANYENYLRDFNSSMRSAYHEKKQFLKISEERKKKYGEAGARPVCRIEKNDPYYSIYYLVKFSKIEKPVPVFLSLKREEGKLKVAFLQFQFSKIKEQNK